MNTRELAMDSRAANLLFRLMAPVMESRMRYRFADPVTILEAAGIRSGQEVLEIGCGTGFFTTSAAELLGDTGHLYAMDPHPLAIEQVHRKIGNAGLANVRLIKADATEAGLVSGCIDLALLFGVIPSPIIPLDRLLAEIHRLLRSEGALAVWTAFPRWSPTSLTIRELFQRPRNGPNLRRSAENVFHVAVCVCSGAYGDCLHLLLCPDARLLHCHKTGESREPGWFYRRCAGGRIVHRHSCHTVGSMPQSPYDLCLWSFRVVSAFRHLLPGGDSGEQAVSEQVCCSLCCLHDYPRGISESHTLGSRHRHDGGLDDPGNRAEDCHLFGHAMLVCAVSGSLRVSQAAQSMAATDSNCVVAWRVCRARGFLGSRAALSVNAADRPVERLLEAVLAVERVCHNLVRRLSQTAAELQPEGRVCGIDYSRGFPEYAS